jgi:hypothetical protein
MSSEAARDGLRYSKTAWTFAPIGPAETRGGLKKQSVCREPWLFLALEPCGRRMLVPLVKYRKIYKSPYAPGEIRV